METGGFTFLNNAYESKARVDELFMILHIYVVYRKWSN